MSTLNSKKVSLLLCLLALLVFGLSALPGAAQDIVTPIGIGQNLTGVIQDPALGQLFRLETDMPQAATLQILSQTPGFLPNFRLMDGNGLTLQSASNAAGLTILDRQIALPSSELYLEVGSANGLAGQFILALQPSAFASGPAALALGQAQTASVSTASPEALFSFDAPADQPVRLMVDSLSAARGVTVALRDGLSGEMLSLSTMRFGAVDFEIMAGSGAYLLEVMHSGADEADEFMVCLTALDPQGCQPAAACTVTPAAGGVNVRSGAGTNYGAIGILTAGINASVVGRTNDGSWLMIDFNGVNGWVAASVVSASADCGAAPVVNVPRPVIDPGIGNGQPAGSNPPAIDPGIGNGAGDDTTGGGTINVPPGFDLPIDSGSDTINVPPGFELPIEDGDDPTINVPPGFELPTGDNHTDDDWHPYDNLPGLGNDDEEDGDNTISIPSGMGPIGSTEETKEP